MQAEYVITAVRQRVAHNLYTTGLDYDDVGRVLGVGADTAESLVRIYERCLARQIAACERMHADTERDEQA